MSCAPKQRLAYPRGLPTLTDIVRLVTAHPALVAQLAALTGGIALTVLAVRTRASWGSVRANVAQDFAHVVFRAIAIIPLTALLFGLLAPANGLSLRLLDPVPVAVALVAYVVVVDLFEYGVHRLFHAVPALWRLHAVHHSQTWVSPLTTTRTHPVELMSKRLLSWVPLLVLGGPRPEWVLWIAVDGFWGFFVHSGLPLSFGPLGRLIVSPRFHAVHHAQARAHHDANFGERLAIWDVLFGTARFDVPADAPKGIDDPDFPIERSADPRAVARTFIAQFTYPFRGWTGASSWRTRAGKLARVGIGVLLALVIAELVARVAGVGPPSFYDFDDELGWAPAPGADGVQTVEGHAHVHIDDAGFRDRPHALVAAPGTFRVAALGDSYTDAIQVELDATWWHRLEGELARCPALSDRTIEVLDFGVRGYGTAQELLTWRRAARHYHPDLTVLLYTPENDLVESTSALSAKRNLAPFFVLDGDRLVLRPPTDGATFLGIPRSTLLRASFALRRRSRVIGLIDLEGPWHSLRDGERASTRFHAPDDPELERLVTYAQSYVPPDTDELATAWRVTDALLTTLASEVASDGSAFVLVSGSAPIQVHPDGERRRAFAARIGVDDLFASERHLETLGARIDVPVLALAPVLATEVDATGAYLHGFAATGMGIGHWNEAGHAAAAHRIAATICATVSP